MILIFEDKPNEKWRVQLNIFDNFQVGQIVSIQDSINAFVTTYNENIGHNLNLSIGDFLIYKIVQIISKNEHFETIVTKNIYLKTI